MGTPTFSPFGAYADVTGVVDATAASEIVALVTEVKKYIPNQDTLTGSDVPPSEHPDFDQSRAHTNRNIRAELDAAAAAIAAAPTS